MSTLPVPVTKRVNMIAEGKTMFIQVVDPLTKLKTNERGLTVALTRVSHTQLLISYLNRGSVLVDLTKPVSPFSLRNTGMKMTMCRRLAAALRDHMKQERSNG